MLHVLSVLNLDMFNIWALRRFSHDACCSCVRAQVIMHLRLLATPLLLRSIVGVGWPTQRPRKSSASLESCPRTFLSLVVKRFVIRITKSPSQKMVNLKVSNTNARPTTYIICKYNNSSKNLGTLKSV